MRILFLPLDSRPVNYRLPCQLLDSTGTEYVVPPLSRMDWFNHPAAFDDIMAFLQENYAVCDALVLSVDHLCYGSLIESRMMETDEKTALERLGLLEKLVRENPKPVYAWSVILRNSISTLSSDDLTTYHALASYSTHLSAYESTHSLMDLAKAESVRHQIPDSVFESYMAARARNHTVNLRCIELVRAGLFSSLLLLVEDSSPFGFQKKETEILLEKSRDLPQVYLHSGTDEGGFLSVTRALNLPDQAISIVHFPENYPSFTALYEDRPFSMTFESTLRFSGLYQGESETVLAILLPPGGIQRNITETTLQDRDIAGIAPSLNRLINSGKHVYLLDLLSANGGSLAMMNQVEHPEYLYGYSAWNTASNSLGSIIAQIRADSVLKQKNLRYLRERILDDLFYQGLVRQRLHEALMRRGEDPLHLHHPELAIAKLQELSDVCLLELSPALRHLAGKFEITLPWNRIFEADLIAGGEAYV